MRRTHGTQGNSRRFRRHDFESLIFDYILTDVFLSLAGYQCQSQKDCVFFHRCLLLNVKLSNELTSRSGFKQEGIVPRKAADGNDEVYVQHYKYPSFFDKTKEIRVTLFDLLHIDNQFYSILAR